MLAVSRIEEISSKLGSYHQQLATLADALEALKSVADLINANLLADRQELDAIGSDLSRPSVDLADLPAASAQLHARIAEEDTTGAAFPASAPEMMCDELSDGIAAVEPANVAAVEAPATADIAHIESFDAPAGDSQEISEDEPQTADVIPLFGATSDEVAQSAEPQPEPVIEATDEVPAQTLEPALEQPVSTQEDPSASDQAATERMIAEIAAAAHAGETKVVDLAKHRESRVNPPKPSRRRAAGIVAAFAFAMAGTAGFQEFLQTDTAQQFIGLAACDGEAATTSRECAMLAWLLL